MSGILSRPTPTDVAIVVGSNRIAGWQSVSITRSVEAFPSSFAVTAADQYPHDPTRALMQAGQPCQVFVGDDLVVTGYIDRYGISTAPRQHDILIAGRGLCCDLVDCSADTINTPELKNSQVSAANTLDLARKLCAAFKINTRSAVDDLGRAIQNLTIANGETPYEIIERVARYAGYLVYEDETGALVLDRVGTLKMASGFQMPGNVESASSTLSVDQRFSLYCVVWTGINQYQDPGLAGSGSFARAIVTDTTVPRYRPRVIVSEQIVPDIDLGKARANWEKARRIGRSQAISLTCDSWRDSAGMLWTPNRLAPIDMAAHKLVNQQWIIGTVTFRKDGSGTHADLTLMPPDAFNPEPAALNLFDWEVSRGLQQSQSPAPPSTGATPPT